jgi:hypothetical protein
MFSKNQKSSINSIFSKDLKKPLIDNSGAADGILFYEENIKRIKSLIDNVNNTLNKINTIKKYYSGSSEIVCLKLQAELQKLRQTGESDKSIKNIQEKINLMEKETSLKQEYANLNAQLASARYKLQEQQQSLNVGHPVKCEYKKINSRRNG